MQTQTNKNGRARKQDQQDLDRAEGEGMSSPAFSLNGKSGGSVMDLLNVRSLADLKERIGSLTEMVGHQVQERPMMSVGAALGVGIGIGVLLRRGFLGAIIATAASFAVRKFARSAVGGAGIAGDESATPVTVS
jgi:p-aminobenzoyl-glutamate transporter AbgT